MYRATIKNRISRIDQANVQMKINEWSKVYNEDSFFFRSHSDQEEEKVHANDLGERESSINVTKLEDELDEEVLLTNEWGEQNKKLVFVHQTALQQWPLRLYGNHICLLDTTYKTTRYALPLFFLAVKTNVNYQVVGSFVIEDETVRAINEALEVISKWTPD
ncbi:hypothetical protein P5673_018830 [Acropora cervicornis]|uniref:MULE transposase domain-containing protein n=1 Tax=Acropora cervicornis TaxID=6130 RepID=A0AAD9QC90_ACRCE|nr:hypothetical protein P5673_018830 [Acropora cervicornis]